MWGAVALVALVAFAACAVALWVVFVTLVPAAGPVAFAKGWPLASVGT